MRKFKKFFELGKGAVLLMAVVMGVMGSCTSIMALGADKTNHALGAGYEVGETLLNQNTIVPKPVSCTYGTGTFKITADTDLIVYAGSVDLDEVKGAAEYLADKLKPSTGFDLPVIADQSPTADDICFKIIEKDQNLATGVNYATAGDEGYAFAANAVGIQLTAYAPEGLFRGVQTIRQLLPPEIERDSPVNNVDWEIQYINIVDYPRYEYRGIMLDVSRHFYTKEMVLRQIDLVSQYKLNVVHLHLSDDQGFRIAFDGYPELTEFGGSTKILNNYLYNVDNTVGNQPRLYPGSMSYGITPGYYTKADFQEIIDYADERFITIVPEIEFPSHCYSQLLSLPLLNSAGIVQDSALTGTGSSLDGNSAFWTCKVGQSVSVNPNSNTTAGKYTKAYIEDIFDQIAEMLPENHRYIHIGGDEAHNQSHSDFLGVTKLAIDTVRGKGKLSMMWSPPGNGEYYWADIYQLWTADSVGAALAANRNNRVLASPIHNAYIDQYTTDRMPVGHNWVRANSPSDVYNWDPEKTIPAEYRNQGRVIGVEGPVWSETYGTEEGLDMLVYPRIMALGEVAWSPAEDRSGTGAGTPWADFAPRAAAQGSRMTYQGITFANETSIWEKQTINVTTNNTACTTPVDTPRSGQFIFSKTSGQGNPVAIKMMSKPSQGKVTLEKDGNWTYTPAKGFIGKDSFTVGFQVEGYGVPLGDTAPSNRGTGQYYACRNVYIEVTANGEEKIPVTVSKAAARPTNIRVELDPPVPELLASNFSIRGAVVRMAESFDNGSSYVLVTTPRNTNRDYQLSIKKDNYEFNTVDLPVHNISPKPVSFEGQSASFIIKPNTKILVEAENASDLKVSIAAANVLADKLKRAAGYNIQVAASGIAGIRDISMKTISGYQNLAPGVNYETAGDGGYALKIGVDGAFLTAYAPEGIINGIRAISQLLPPEIESDSLVNNVNWVMTYADILDYHQDSVVMNQSGDRIEASYSICNDTKAVQESICILAAYDSGEKLVDIRQKKLTAAPYEGRAATITMPFREDYTLKAFLWDGRTYKPLCEAVTDIQPQQKEPVTVYYSAEMADINSGIGMNLSRNTASPSGWMISNTDRTGAYFQWNQVVGDTDANYLLKIYYATGNTAASFKVIVNGNDAGSISLSGNDWGQFSGVSELQLPSSLFNPDGDNTIRFEFENNGGANVGQISVTTY